MTEGIRFTLEYDTNSWEEAGESSGGALPVLRRTGYDMHLALIAQQQRTEDNGKPSLDDGGNEIWDEICRRRAQLAGLGVGSAASALKDLRERGPHLGI